MKKLLFGLALLACSLTRANAQTEIKVNPVALMFYGIGVGVEHGFSDEFGLDLSTLIIGGEGALVWLSGKYYLNPRNGLDRFHLGLFSGAATGYSPGLGFLLGTKTVSKSNRVLFEFGLGAGRTFDG